MRETYAHYHVSSVKGPKSVYLNQNEAAVICLVKNGEYYIKSFIEHYLEKGFSHIFLLDNCSTDNTISYASRYPQVSIYQTCLPVNKYQAILKKIFAKKTVKSGWCLDVDIDEYFDYPLSDKVDLDVFLGYLNTQGYSAVVTQMLDLFSEYPLSHLVKQQQEDIKAVYRYYDISSIQAVEYFDSELTHKYAPDNCPTNTEIKLYFGGIRKRLYGLNCLLSKHSLFSMQDKIVLFPHVHFVNKAKLADISCVLMHYKLTSNAIETAIQNKKYFTATSQGYSDFIKLIETNPDYQIINERSMKLDNINQLILDDFIVVSKQYCDAVCDRYNGQRRDICE